MAIIIRLQNLPWSANSLDIRRFFEGLTIPEGGVHIVGGEKGDAFIAFMTDEDARQAMERDYGKIKDVRIKLLLSSRAEMQRVIENARTQIQQSNSSPPMTKPRKTSPEKSRSSRDKSKKSSSSRKRSRTPSPATKRSSSSRQSSREHRPKEEKKREKQSEETISSATISANNKPETPNPVSNENGNEQISEPPNVKPEPSPVYPQSGNSPTMPANTNMAANLGYPSLFPIVKPSDVLQSVAQGLDRMADPSSYGGPPMGMNPIGMVPMGMNPMGMYPMGWTPMPMVPNRYMDGGVYNQMGMGPNQMPGPNQMQDPNQMMGPNLMPGPNQMMGPNRMQGPPLEGEIEDPLLQPPNNYGGGYGSGPITRPGLDARPTNKDDPPVWQENTPLSLLSSTIGRGSYRDLDLLLGNSRLPVPTRAPSPVRGFIPGCCVVVNGIPPNATYKDIRVFFLGAFIVRDGIKIINDEIEDRAVRAYVRFSSERDLHDGMRKSNSVMMNKSKVEIKRCSDGDFENAVDPFLSGAAANLEKSRFGMGPREDDLVVVIEGLPIFTKEDDIVDFFENIPIADMFMECDHVGRALGTAYIEFGSVADTRQAMALSGKNLGHVSVKLSYGNKEIMRSAMEEPRFKQNVESPGPQTYCLSVGNLPADITDKALGRFLSEGGAMPVKIHLKLNPNGESAGDAFAEFSTMREQGLALKMNGTMLGPLAIELRALPFDKMMDILNLPMDRQMDNYDDRFDNRGPPDRFEGRGPPGRFEGRGPPDRFEGRGPPDRFEGRGPPERFDGRGPPNRFHDRGPPNRFDDRGPHDRFHDRGPPDRFDDRGRPGRYDDHGPPNRFDDLGPPDDGYDCPNWDGPPRFNKNNMMGDGDDGPPGPRMYGPEEDGMLPGGEQFQRPRCVVGVMNLPFKSTSDDVIGFLNGFGLKPENVLRRYDHQGRATGEARVAFRTPEDAKKALGSKSGHKMNGRPIRLFLI